MINEKYTQLYLYCQFGDVRTMGFIQSLANMLEENYDT